MVPACAHAGEVYQSAECCYRCDHNNWSPFDDHCLSCVETMGLLRDPMLMGLLAILLFYVITLIHDCDAEIYTSSQQIVQLEENEGKLIAVMQDYIREEGTRLKSLREFVSEAKKNLTERLRYNKTNPVQDPVNSYLIIKRFENTWAQQISKLQHPQNLQVTLKRIQGIIPEFPSKIDTERSIQAIVRLQTVYNLSVGHFRNMTSGEKYTSSDCFQFAQSAFVQRREDIATEWLTEALRLKEVDAGFRQAMVSQLLVAARRQVGIRLSSLPSPCDSNQTSDAQRDTSRKCTNSKENLDDEKFYALCRDQSHQWDLPNTTCEYKETSMPYLRWKKEILSRDPEIYIFHDVINDFEMDHLLQIATPLLERAGVGKPDSGVYHEARTSKVAWLWDNHTHIINRLSRRVAEITDLCTEFKQKKACAEPLQVLNYGIGGQYHAHYDYYTNQTMVRMTAPFVRDSGDRLATFMFYLNEVEAGGATVFPEIGVRIPPTKGGAAFWYNYKDGLGDPRTKHGGCPVLLGQKWVANKWIHEIAAEKKNQRCPVR